jgi:hypothetical protein
LLAYLAEKIVEYSADWAVPLLADTFNQYQVVAKTVNDTIEIGYIPEEWAGDDSLPLAHQSVPKEWIAYAGVFAPGEGINPARMIFGRKSVGNRQSNPGNPEGNVTIATASEGVYPEVQRTLAVWEQTRQVQEQFNRRFAEISSRVEHLNATFAELVAQYSKEEMLAITLGLAPVESGCYELWATVLMQDGRRMTLSGRESPELTVGHHL